MRLKLLILLAFFAQSASAGVNLKNGNFYISFGDISVPGTGKKLEIIRTYNSKSTEKGWFGFGWGSEYETKLIPSADGCAVIHEHGAGGKTRFCPKNSVDPKKASQKIIVEMKKKSKNITGSAEKELLKKLISNADLRHAYARRFGVKTQLAAGSMLYSNDRGIQTLKVTKDGYMRASNDGLKEYFNKNGNLVKTVDKNNYKVELTYKGKSLFSIKDSFAKQIFFDWYADGKVKALWSLGDAKSVFKYENENLVFSRDVSLNQYEYKYDSNHNLTKIVYNPGRKKGTKEDAMIMAYDPKNSFVRSVTSRSGDVTEYKYGANEKNPKDHYWTLVTKEGYNNKKVTNRYEYEIKAKPDGQRYTYRILTIISGIKTETIYSECCGLPVKIARGKNVTNFEYNDKGLLTKKSSTRGEYVKIEYDKELNKISKVVNNAGWTNFSYDKKGNLTKAVNSKGKAVLLIYNSKGKIKKMVDRNTKAKTKRVLAFKYNSLGKPVEIEMEKVGKIQVAYDNYGEIKKVESKSGNKMALQVTQAFQNLLAIVKPAGVNLNM